MAGIKKAEPDEIVVEPVAGSADKVVSMNKEMLDLIEKLSSDPKMLAMMKIHYDIAQ